MGAMSASMGAMVGIDTDLNVGTTSVMTIYWKSSDIDIRVHSDIRYPISDIKTFNILHAGINSCPLISWASALPLSYCADL
jgi:hypothetical protein